MKYNNNLNKSDINECIKQIMVIAKQRENLLEMLKQAVVNDEHQNIRLYAAKLCGVEHESC
jgi:hypothetical protein